MTLSDRILITVLEWFARSGAVEFVSPEASPIVIGDGAVEASLAINDRRAYGRILRNGVLGFSEAYMDGQIDTDDIGALLDWGARNHASRTGGRAGTLTAPIRSVWQRLASERRHERVVTMVDHYNLGNDFYASWLDSTMTYSSGRFIGPDTSLEEAQINKYRRVAELAGLEPGMRVLEIGCGWGGFAAYAAAEWGVDVVGVTIAEAQANYARKHLAAVGVADRTDIRLTDFRAVDGTFDAVVSIEMIESVDETVWPELFSTVAARLRPGANAVFQAITIDDDRFEGYRRRSDFIQRYVFPGGQLPSPAVLTSLGDAAGLSTVAVEQFGLDYARTLDMWGVRFDAAWPHLVDLGLDERFRRLWKLYLVYCAAGFRTGTIDVQQRVYHRSA